MRAFCRILGLGGIAIWAFTAVAEEGPWETVVTSPILVKSRVRPNSSIREIWAEGEMNAPVQDIQSTVMESERFPTFMPYVKEARHFGTPDPDGGRFVYTRLQLPLVASRDYVLKVFLEQSVLPDGSGEFRNRWVAVPDRIPKRANSIRVRVDEGSWHVKPREDGNKSWAIYKFCADPGGWIPSFAVDLGNKSGVTDTFKAVEKEAQRRTTQRKSRLQQP